MALTFRAHYDGRSFIPDEEVSAPVGVSLELQLLTPPDEVQETEEQRRARSRAALERFLARAIPGTNISLESMRRENLYDDRM